MNGEAKRRADKNMALRFDIALSDGVMALKRRKKKPVYVAACRYCGNWFHVQALTLDHVVPKRDGGTYERKNLVVCCSLCNLRKEPFHLSQWFRRCATSPGAIPPIIKLFQAVIA